MKCFKLIFFGDFLLYFSSAILFFILLYFFLVAYYLNFIPYPTAIPNPTNFEKKNDFPAFHFSFNAFSLIIFLRWWAKKRERGKKIYLDCNESNLALTSKETEPSIQPPEKPNNQASNRRTFQHNWEGIMCGNICCITTTTNTTTIGQENTSFHFEAVGATIWMSLPQKFWKQE